MAGSILTLDPNFTFTTSSLSNIDGAKIFVNSGLNFNRVTDNIYTGSFANNSETILRADGIGSSLNLSSLTSIVANETSIVCRRPTRSMRATMARSICRT